jgi:hypothetical protein
MHFYFNSNSCKVVIFSIVLFGTSVAFGSAPAPEENSRPRKNRQQNLPAVQPSLPRSGFSIGDAFKGLCGGVLGAFCGRGIADACTPLRNYKLLAAGVGGTAVGVYAGLQSHSNRKWISDREKEIREDERKKHAEEDRKFRSRLRYYFYSKDILRVGNGKKEYDHNVFNGIYSDLWYNEAHGYRQYGGEKATEDDRLEAHIFYTLGVEVAPHPDRNQLNRSKIDKVHPSLSPAQFIILTDQVDKIVEKRSKQEGVKRS